MGLNEQEVREVVRQEVRRMFERPYEFSIDSDATTTFGSVKATVWRALQGAATLTLANALKEPGTLLGLWGRMKQRLRERRQEQELQDQRNQLGLCPECDARDWRIDTFFPATNAKEQHASCLQCGHRMLVPPTAHVKTA